MFVGRKRGKGVNWVVVVCCDGGEGRHTMALLGEEEISLLGGREIGDSVTGVEHGWSLVGGEGGVGTDCAALVVTEAAAGD